MRNVLLTACVLFVLAVLSPRVFGQAEQPASQPAARATSQATSQMTGQAAATAAKPGTVAANTQITAALESAVDARTAKPGDIVTARVTKDVKQNGQVVIHKGDHLLGKVVSQQSSANAKSGSSFAVAFDQLKNAQGTSQLQTVVTSVLSTSAGPSNEPGEMSAPAPVMAAPQGGSPPPQGGGGLLGGGGGPLGGVGSSVGSTLGATGSVAGGAGGVLDAASGATLGSTTGAAVSTPARAVHVESQGSASQSAGVNSIFSTSQGNLHLDSGSTLEFRVVGQAPKPTQP